MLAFLLILLTIAFGTIVTVCITQDELYIIIGLGLAGLISLFANLISIEERVYVTNCVVAETSSKIFVETEPIEDIRTQFFESDKKEHFDEWKDMTECVIELEFNVYNEIIGKRISRVDETVE